MSTINKIKHLMDHGMINDPARLDSLKTVMHSHIRYAVAKHPNTSQQTLHHLATDDNDSIRKAVVEHPNTHEQTLAYMRDNDDHAYVRVMAHKRLQE